MIYPIKKCFALKKSYPNLFEIRIWKLIPKKIDIFATEDFFLKDFKEIYSTEIKGKDNGFQNFLNNLKIKIYFVDITN